MTPKEKLLVLAVAFGIVTEGLTTNAQIQEALDKNTGYQKYQEALTAAGVANTAKEAAEKIATELEGQLRTAKQDTEAAHTAYLAANDLLAVANAKLEVLAAVEAEADADKVFYTAANGDKYQVTQDAFRFQGDVHNAAEAVVNNTEVLEALVAAKSFILKKV